MLSLTSISKNFDAHQALKNVSLEIPTGTTHGLIGSSGSGKTTLIRIALGTLTADSGQVTGGSSIGYVPQEGGLFPHLTAKENITLMAQLRKRSRQSIQARLTELTELVSLNPNLMNRYPSELSGGQRQRVALMRAAFLDPEILILDEPLGALDPLIRFELQDELRSIFQKLNKTVLLVTHDLGEAVFFSDRITLLHQGSVIQSGRYDEFVRKPASEFVTRFLRAQRTLPPELEVQS